MTMNFQRKDFQRKIVDVSITKHNDVPDADRERSIGLTCTAAAEVHGDEASYALQIRAQMRLANMTEGKDFAIATASLRLGDLCALRQAAGRAILEINRGLRAKKKQALASAPSPLPARKRT